MRKFLLLLTLCASFGLSLPSVAQDLDLNADGQRLAIASYDNSVRICDMRG